MIQIQITLEVEGNRVDAIRAVSKALYDGVIQNAICEHDIEGVAPLSLYSIIVGEREGTEQAFRVLDGPIEDAPTVPSQWPQDCVVIPPDSPMHLTKLGRELLARRERIAQWDPPPRFQTGDYVVAEAGCFEVVEPDLPSTRNYILREIQQTHSAPEHLMRLLVKGDGKLKPPVDFR